MRAEIVEKNKVGGVGENEERNLREGRKDIVGEKKEKMDKQTDRQKEGKENMEE